MGSLLRLGMGLERLCRVRHLVCMVLRPVGRGLLSYETLLQQHNPVRTFNIELPQPQCRSEESGFQKEVGSSSNFGYSLNFMHSVRMENTAAVS